MKLFTVILLLCISCLHAFAQTGKVREARDYLSENNYKAALPLIEQVVKTEKDDAEAWFLHGMVYLQMTLDSTVSSPASLQTATVSLLKALSLKPDYRTEIDVPLHSLAILHFNKGVEQYGAKFYGAAYKEFSEIEKLHGGRNRFSGNAEFTELVSSAKLNAAYAAMNAGKLAESQQLFERIINEGGTKDSNLYQALIEVYQKQKNDEKALATIKAARTEFPASALFRNLELNYYIGNGRKDELMPKLEDALKQDPDNAELVYNLANAYTAAAFPTDENGKPAATAPSYFEKAETAYRNLLRRVPYNPDYNYNFGVIYYSLASDYNRQMAAIKGMSAAEDKAYNALKSNRDAQFRKALPFFENASGLLEGKAESAGSGEKVTYQNALTGLREIYTRLEEKAKLAEVKRKLEALR